MKNLHDLMEEEKCLRETIKKNDDAGALLRLRLAELRVEMSSSFKSECPHSKPWVNDVENHQEYCPNCYLTRDVPMGVS